MSRELLKILCLISGTTCFKMINHYLEYKDLNQASFVGCLNNNEKLDLVKEMSRNYKQVSVFVLKSLENNVTLLNISKSHNGVILDSNCDGADLILHKCGLQYLFDFTHHWMIMSNNKTKIITILQEVIIHINADINIFLNDSTNPNIQVIDAYNPSKNRGGNLVYNIIGFYNESKGGLFIYENYQTGCKYVLRKNMKGIEFSTVMVIPSDHNLIKYNNQTVRDYIYNKTIIDQNRYNRFHAAMMIHVSQYYNFSFNITLLNVWGSKNEGGNFSGLFGMVQKNKVDFSLPGSAVKTELLPFLSYGKRGTELGSVFVFLNPKMCTSLEVFFKPLKTEVWLLSLITIAVFAIFIKFTMKREKTLGREIREIRWSLWALVTFGIFCQQGNSVESKMYGTKTLIIFLFINAILIYQYFSAALVSNILMAPPTLVTTVYDLLHSHLKFGYQEYPYMLDFFMTTEDTAVQRLGNKTFYTKNPNMYNFVSLQKGVKLVRQGGYAYHVEGRYAYPLIEDSFNQDQICKLREINMMKGTNATGFVVFQKWSPFKDMLDTAYQRLIEVGIFSFEERFWTPRKPECLQNAFTYVSSAVDFQETYPAFAFLFIGMVLSLFLAIIEKQHHKYVHKH